MAVAVALSAAAAAVAGGAASEGKKTSDDASRKLLHWSGLGRWRREHIRSGHRQYKT